MVVGVGIDITGDASGLSKALGQAQGEVKGFGNALSGIPIPQIAAAGAALGIVAKVGQEVVVAGLDSAAAEKQFAASLDAAGVSSQTYAGAMDDAVKASQALAFTDDETMHSLTTLAGATGDAQTSIELLAAAQDISRLAGVSLESATDAVAKAYAGSDTALTKMIPGLEKGATGMDTVANASKLAAGQADIYAQSAEGIGITTTGAFQDIKESVGQALLPALEELGKALLPLLVSFGELVTALLPVLIPLVKAVADVAVIAAKAIVKVVDAVTWLITKIRELLGPLRDAVGMLGNLDLNPFNGKAAPASAAYYAAPSVSGLQSGGGGSATRSGGVQINIYGDPSVIEAKVTKALRDYSRRNGIGSVFAPGRS